MKNCTPLWHEALLEAHFEVKSVKAGCLQALFEVKMSKKCTPLWREAHVEVKMLKAHHIRTTFGCSRHDNDNYS